MSIFFHALFLIFALVGFTYFIYIAIHVIGWSRIPVSIPSNNHTAKTKITVIIAARNEETTIGKCLDTLSVQTYPENLWELIVMDDHSTDRTKEVAEKKLANIKISSKVISNKKNEEGKKNAIAEAIRNSSGELIVITDADCQSKPKWLSIIESEYQRTGAYMLCGPVDTIDESGFLGRFQSLEEDGFSLLSGAGIKIGIPLLCSGANIAYTRKVFEDVEGFKSIDAHPTGDDVLLMFKVHQKYPGKVACIKSRKAVISTHLPDTFKDFINQRIRWGSKGFYSKNFANSFISILVFASNLLSVIAILSMLAFRKIPSLLVFGVTAKVMADFLLLFSATHFFGRKKHLWIFPLAEVFTMLYISWVGIVANSSAYTWKDRLYKHST